MTDFITEQRPLEQVRQRKFTPGGYSAPPGTETAGGFTSMLWDDSTGDWSWKPYRDKRLGDKMVTFRGVPHGAAELYGPRILP
jgi:hypothetical protein